jgi:hypothetical protein
MTTIDITNITDTSGFARMFNGSSSFNQDLSHWCVPTIPSLPLFFDQNATSWVLSRPIWGTCPP